MLVGFIGLGIMGLPMARNLLSAGFAVSGHNRNHARTALLTKDGGRPADSVADAVAGAEIVITMLPDGPDVEAVLLGPDGAIENAAPGTVIIDMSTIHPVVSRRVAEQAGRKGIQVLDAPVSGGEKGAVDGALSIMVGGDLEAFNAVLPVLNAMGNTVTYVGDSGAGQTVKAANQLIVAVSIGAVAEALAMLEALNVETAAAVKVLAGGLAGSRVLEQKADMMRARQFRPGFKTALHHKDLGIALGIARDAGVVTPLGAQVAQEVASLVAQGHGDLDHSSIKLLVDQLSGRA